MIKFKTVFIIVITCTCSVFSQVNPYISYFEKISGNIYKVTSDMISYKVNSLVSVGEDGVLMVDTGTEETAPELLKKILALGKGYPKIIINSHVHGDHTYGNKILGKEAIIIAHREVTNNLLTRNLVAEISRDALPDIDFTDSISVYFNGEKINLVAFPGSHSSSDIIIYFTKSRIAYLGDLAYGLQFPSTDGMTGDNTKYAEVVGKVIAYLPKDTKLIVSGHGQDLTLDEYHEFYSMLEKTTEIVRREYEKGKDAETMIKENILKEWESFSVSGYQTTEGWIEGLVKDFSGIKTKPYISNPLYTALKNGGVQGAIDKYNDIKKNHSDEYSYFEIGLYWIGDYLLKKNRIKESLEFLNFALREYPQSTYIYTILGEAYFKNGDKQMAVDSFKKALKSDPTNEEAETRLNQLQNNK